MLPSDYCLELASVIAFEQLIKSNQSISSDGKQVQMPRMTVFEIKANCYEQYYTLGLWQISEDGVKSKFHYAMGFTRTMLTWLDWHANATPLDDKFKSIKKTNVETRDKKSGSRMQAFN